MISKAEEVPKKKKFTWWLGMSLAFIVISAGTFLFFYWEGKNPNHQIVAADMKNVTLPSFTVNLADASSRYLRTTITLESPSKKVEEELKTSPYRVKDSILKVLRNTRASSLIDPQNTELLKQELLKEINSSLTSGQVTALYFDEFIVQ